MKEQLISFETAKLAKEKGFIFKCNKIYLIHGDLHVNELISDKIFFQAPTQSLLQKWLREVHNIFVSCSYNHISCDGTYYIWYGVMSKTCNMKENFKTWEEALEFGLQKALKLIK